MRISLLCSDRKHPVIGYLQKWVNENNTVHQIELVHTKTELSGGDILFLVSCSEIISAVDRKAYSTCLVLHASDLPHGRGWSPHVWQLIAGAEELTLSLLEAEDKVDSGKIWRKLKFPIPKHALWNEINASLFEAEIKLIDYAVNEFGRITPMEQADGIKSTYYLKRSPADSQIDPMQSIASQFDKIRVCDPDRFPAYFELHGNRYKINLEKISVSTSKY